MKTALALTHNCNLRCVYCYAGEKFSRSMTVEIGRRAIDFTAEQSIYDMSITFFGGEPLLEFSLMQELADYAETRAKSAGLFLKTYVTTNGTLVNDDFIAFCRKHDTKVTLSLDGNEKAQNINRPQADGSGSYALVEKNFDRILNYNPLTDIFMVVTPRTIPFLSESITLLRGRGFQRFDIACNFEGDWTPADLAALEEQYNALADFYVDTMRAGHDIHIDMIDGKIRNRINPHYACDHVCEIARGEIAVSPQGNIYPCLRFTAEDRDTNSRIGDIWKGFDEEKRGQFFAERKLRREECLECDHNGRCLNNCGALNFLLTGNVNYAAGVVCAHERMAIPIADRVGNILYQEKNPLFMHKFYPDTK